MLGIGRWNFLNVSDKFRRKCAIKTVAKRQRISFRFQAQDRCLREDAANDFFVLFRFKATRAVNKRAVRF